MVTEMFLFANNTQKEKYFKVIHLFYCYIILHTIKEQYSRFPLIKIFSETSVKSEVFVSVYSF